MLVASAGWKRCDLVVISLQFDVLLDVLIDAHTLQSKRVSSERRCVMLTWLQCVEHLKSLRSLCDPYYFFL